MTTLVLNSLVSRLNSMFVGSAADMTCGKLVGLNLRYRGGCKDDETGQYYDFYYHPGCDEHDVVIVHLNNVVQEIAVV